MKKASAVAGLAGIALFSVPLTLVADGHEEEAPAELSDVWIMEPKQGMVSEFEEALKKHMAFRADAGEERTWYAYTPVIGDKLSMYQFRACCFDWADQDTYIESTGAMGLDDHWNENVDPYVDHYHHYLEKMDWENSHWPDGSNGPFYEVTTWVWREDAGPGPSEARKKLSQAAKEAGWGDAGNNWLWHSRIGGKPKLMIVSSHASFADMAPPEQSFMEFMADAMSEEELEEMFTAFGSGFSSSETTVWRHREELSTPNGE